MTRDQLIRLVDRLDREGGFAKAIGQASLLADKDNLDKLIKTFPEIFGSMKLKLVKGSHHGNDGYIHRG